MKKKFLLILPAVLTLTACPKTDNLYERNAYNKGFFQDYYTEFEGLDKVNLDRVDASAAVISKHDGAKFETKMSEENDGYRHGILSKLYDGQVVCGGMYQLSRVQLNKDGFGTRLIESKDVNKMQFSIRGGSSCENPLNRELNFNLFIGLYTSDKIVNLDFENVSVPTDKSAETRLFDVSFSEIKGVYGYTMKFTCDSFASQPGVTENDELALMLYEVVLK